MSWHLGRLAAFDIETTGVDYSEARIVTAALSIVGGNARMDSRTWLVDPGVEIPAGATAVHGITTEQARAEGQVAAEAIEEITAQLSDQLGQSIPIVAFNARFDLTILDREARRYGIQPLSDRVGDKLLVVDPHLLDKQFDRYRKGKRTLEAVCAHYNLPLDGAHSADADAVAAARVAWRLGQTYEEIGGVELPVLHAHEIEWAAEQAESLQEYFSRQGKNELVEPAWPIVPLDVG